MPASSNGRPTTVDEGASGLQRERVSLVAQRIDRIQRSGAHGWVYAEEQAHGKGDGKRQQYGIAGDLGRYLSTAERNLADQLRDADAESSSYQAAYYANGD